MKFKDLDLKLKLLTVATLYMSYRFIGGIINLIWIFTENERAASGDWGVAFAGDTVIGLFAIILGYQIIKKPSQLLWAFVFSWNAVGAFDIVGAISGTIFSPFAPFPELGIGYSGFQVVLISNLLIHAFSFYLLSQKSVRSYMGLKVS